MCGDWRLFRVMVGVGYLKRLLFNDIDPRCRVTRRLLSSDKERSANIGSIKTFEFPRQLSALTRCYRDRHV